MSIPTIECENTEASLIQGQLNPKQIDKAVNLVRLDNTWDKIFNIRSTGMTLRVMSAGDSLGYRILRNGDLADALTTAFGWTGTDLMNFSRTGTTTSRNGQNEHFITGQTTLLSTNGEIEFQPFRFSLTSYFPATRITIPIVHENGAGTFKIQTQTEGGSWTDVTIANGASQDLDNVDADNGGDPETIFYQFTISKDSYRAKIVRLTGDVEVVDYALFEDTSSDGVVTMNISRDGMSIEQGTQMSSASLDNMIAAIQPDILFIQFNEQSTDLTNYLENFINQFLSRDSNTDIVLSSQGPFKLTDYSYQQQLDARSWLIDLAINQRYSFLDQFYMLGGLDNPNDPQEKLRSLNWEGDELHFSDVAYGRIAQEFFTLGSFVTRTKGMSNAQIRDFYTGGINSIIGPEVIGDNNNFTWDVRGNENDFARITISDRDGGQRFLITSYPADDSTFPGQAAISTPAPFGSIILMSRTGTKRVTIFDELLANTKLEATTSVEAGTFLQANGRRIYSGTGTPEGNQTGDVGDLYTRQDGGANTTLYVKESGTGNTGWAAK